MEQNTPASVPGFGADVEHESRSERQCGLDHPGLNHLSETSEIYLGLSSKDADRLRGYILSQFATSEVSVGVFPFVLEELSIGDSPYCAAAAARVLQLARNKPVWAAHALTEALERFRHNDDTIWFSPTAATKAPKTTVHQELAKAIESLGGLEPPLLQRLKEFKTLLPAIEQFQSDSVPNVRVDASACCRMAHDIKPVPCLQDSSNIALEDIQLEDQHGCTNSFADWFDRELNIIAFFYTRCMNPTKCSATIEKLAVLHNELGALSRRCRIAAISYEPDYDLPHRLMNYGKNRGIDDASAVRLLRCREGMENIHRYFDLHVGFGESTINRHRSEVFLLNEKLQPVATILRRKFTVTEVVSVVTKNLANVESAG